MEKTPEEAALGKAKIQLMATPNSAFYAHIAFSLRHVFDDTIPTACANGKVVKYNTNFFMSLTAEERLFLILHEVLHCAYMHMGRLQDRIHGIFNQAADHVINLQLIDAGFKMPKVGLADPQFRGMNTEQVYEHLLANPPPPGTTCWDDLDPTGSSGELQKEMEDILIGAAVQSKLACDKPGTIPGEIQIFLDNLLNPKLPWKTILRKYFNKFSKGDYSFKKPNRRFFPTHYLPSLYSPSLMDLAIAIDSSGSVSDIQFKQFVSEIACIFKMFKPKKITLIQFDCVIHSIDEIKNFNDLMQCEFTGRGGTCVLPVFDWVNEHKPQLTLIFTDGQFSLGDCDTKQDLVWLINDNPSWKTNLGKVIHYESPV